MVSEEGGDLLQNLFNAFLLLLVRVKDFQESPVRLWLVREASVRQGNRMRGGRMRSGQNRTEQNGTAKQSALPVANLSDI